MESHADNITVKGIGVAQHRRSLLERLHEVEAISDYADTAFTGNMEPKSVPPKVKRRPSASTILPNGTRCHEYLAIETHSDRLNWWNTEFSRQRKPREGRQWERMRSRDKIELPRGYILYNWFSMFSTWFKLFRAVAMVFAWGGPIIGVFLLLFILLTSGVAVFLEATIEFFLPYAIALPIGAYLLFRIIDDLELATWLDPDPKPAVIYRRDLGLVVLRRFFRNKYKTVPFAETQGVNRMVAYNTVSSGYMFEIQHKHSKISQSANQQSSTMLDGYWFHIIEWEILQHYMDVTRPLPDIPRFEPFRHLDPVTKA
ncbi:MAG: hypothetical protein LAT65_08590 [Saccharospirillum sp.]|nr:hypothetical protein [Saccharospirillum sp.]